MTDGPFKNLKLDSRSKRFAEAVQNEAEDHETRCALANHAIVGGIISGNKGLIRDLHSYGQSGQLDLDPKGLIKSIFDANPKSEFADHLQRDVSLRLYEGEPFRDAIKNSFEACMNGPMHKDQFDRLIGGSNDVIKSLDRPRILHAITNCNKDAFKQDVKKKEGLDEGPRL